ncbi:identity crisis [Musca autumnalis]|uniref:identity crisis n=1 Tax=Musca autumnalis TaxID=221902 RepID=UPI003CF5D038
MSCVNNRWQICRICLKNGKHELFAIFEGDEKINDLGSLPEKIQQYGGIKIYQQNNLPSKICSRCVLLLRAACKFRDLCEQSNEQLKQFINPLKQEEVGEVLSQQQDQECIIINTNTHDIEEGDDKGTIITIMKDEIDDIQDHLEDNEAQEEEREEERPEDEDDEERFVYEQLNENSQNDFLTENSNSYSLDDNVHIEYFEGSKEQQSYSLHTMVQNKNSEDEQTTKTVRTATKRKRTKASQNDDIQPEEGGIYRCSFCENVYQDKAKYVLHIKIHKKVKPHECEICGKRFSTTPQLSRHMNSHTGNRPYKCKYCDASFGDPSTKIKHERIHTNERPYKCSLCPKSFAYSNVLKVHMMVHTGEKPHRCAYCNRAFSQLHHKNAHEQCHKRKIILVGDDEDNDDYEVEMKEYEYCLDAYVTEAKYKSILTLNSSCIGAQNMKSGLNQKWLVCRICLKQPKDEMQTIFDKNAEKDLTRMILECGGVPIKQFDHYPDKICKICYKYLQVAYKFRQSCQRSHRQLSKFIAPVEVEEIEQKDEIDCNAADDEETNDSLPNTVAFTEEGYVLEDANGDDVLIKLEQETTIDHRTTAASSSSAVPVKEEYSVQIQEEEDDDFVEIYEPMTEEEEKEVFQLADEAFETDSLAGSQDHIEYLELEEDLELPSSDNDDYLPAENRKPARSRVVMKRTVVKPSTSQLAAKPTGHQSTKRKRNSGRGAKSKDQAYICDFCGNKYPSQGRLTEHIKLHKGIKPHECEICGYAFAQTQQLARHMNTHTGNRPYKCSYCPAAFADLSTRNKHHRIHTNERPYVCDVCGKSFTYTNTLKFHKMIHTGEKPFVCDICGKGFQQAYKLRTHKLTHERKGIKANMTSQQIDNSMEQPTYQEMNVETATHQLLQI